MLTKSLLPVVLTALAAGTLAVDLPTCNSDVQSRLRNQSLSEDDAIFFWNGTHHMSEPGSLQLTIAGCRSTCHKPNFDLYGDMWPRLLTWLFPVLLMMGNLHLPKVGNFNRVLVLVHFIGDPVDSMWSLLTKGEVWNRFYHIALRHAPAPASTGPGPSTAKERDMAARAFAALMSAFDELTDDMSRARADLEATMAETAEQLSRADLDYILKETADELVDSRANEVLRSALVIVNYLWTVVASLVPSIGGQQSSKPGGRIGTALFLSWLVTAVMLSNTLSGFASRRTCLRIMERYCRTVKGRKRDLHVFPNTPRLVSQSRSAMMGTGGADHHQDDGLQDFFASQPWKGSVYSYRKNKRLAPSGSASDKSPLYLLRLSLAPLILAIIGAFIAIFFTPNVGLGCRSLWVLSFGAALLVSPLLTYIITRMHNNKLAWYLVVLKDCFISVPMLVVVILSSMGIFNTCWCWSAVYSRGYSKAFVILDPLDERDLNGHTVYPGVTAAILCLQICVFTLMYHIMKPGGKVFRLSEEERDKQYQHVHGDGRSDKEMMYRSPPPGMATSPAYPGYKPGATPGFVTAYQGGGGGGGVGIVTTAMGGLELPAPAISPVAPHQYGPVSTPSSSWVAGPTSPQGRHVSPTMGYDQTGYVASPGEWRTADQPLLHGQRRSS